MRQIILVITLLVSSAVMADFTTDTAVDLIKELYGSTTTITGYKEVRRDKGKNTTFTCGTINGERAVVRIPGASEKDITWINTPYYEIQWRMLCEGMSFARAINSWGCGAPRYSIYISTFQKIISVKGTVCRQHCLASAAGIKVRLANTHIGQAKVGINQNGDFRVEIPYDSEKTPLDQDDRDRIQVEVFPEIN